MHVRVHILYMFVGGNDHGDYNGDHNGDGDWNDNVAAMM